MLFFFTHTHKHFIAMLPQFVQCEEKNLLISNAVQPVRVCRFVYTNTNIYIFYCNGGVPLGNVYLTHKKYSQEEYYPVH